MISALVQEFPQAALAALAVSCAVVGYLELLILKSIDAAAFTWFFGVVFIVIAIASVGGGSIASWSAAAMVGLAGLVVLVVTVRRWRRHQHRL
jgi:hypothetical protein